MDPTNPNPDIIPWWQSKLIWVQIVALIYGAIRFVENTWAFHLLPEDLTEGQLVDAIMTLVALSTIIMRNKSNRVVDTKTYKLMQGPADK